MSVSVKPTGQETIVEFLSAMSNHITINYVKCIYNFHAQIWLQLCDWFMHWTECMHMSKWVLWLRLHPAMYLYEWSL